MGGKGSMPPRDPPPVVRTTRRPGGTAGLYARLNAESTFWVVVVAAVVMEPSTGNAIRKFVLRQLAVGVALAMGVCILQISFQIVHVPSHQIPDRNEFLGHVVSVGLAICACVWGGRGGGEGAVAVRVCVARGRQGDRPHTHGRLHRGLPGSRRRPAPTHPRRPSCRRRALITLNRHRWKEEFGYAFFLCLLTLCIVTVPALR